jgi:hypothetical protein
MDDEAPLGSSDHRFCILTPMCFGIPTLSEILECKECYFSDDPENDVIVLYHITAWTSQTSCRYHTRYNLPSVQLQLHGVLCRLLINS